VIAVIISSNATERTFLIRSPPVADPFDIRYPNAGDNELRGCQEKPPF